jgi:hypothetical protein
MRTVPLPALLPRLTLADREGGHRPSARGSRSRRPLALPRLPEPVRRDVVFGMGRLDAGGRITDRATMTNLRWSPGHRVRYTIRDGLIIAAIDPTGQRCVGERGQLRLPVAIRRACRLSAGDQILLAAIPERQRLILHPPATLAALTAGVYDSVIGGEDR